MNAKNLSTQFANENKSFNAAARFIFERANEDVRKEPAAVDKGDVNRAAYIKELHAVQAWNQSINDCKAICAALQIDVAALTKKGRCDLRVRTMSRIANVDTNGYAVTFRPIAAMTNVCRVMIATWIEVFATAATAEPCDDKNVYTLTTPPVCRDGQLVAHAEGDIVDANGTKLDTPDVFATWETLSLNRHLAALAGRQTAADTLARLSEKK